MVSLLASSRCATGYDDAMWQAGAARLWAALIMVTGGPDEILRLVGPGIQLDRLETLAVERRDDELLRYLDDLPGYIAPGRRNGKEIARAAQDAHGYFAMYLTPELQGGTGRSL